MTKQEKLEKFITDNDLKFDDDGSGLNSECCIISGYALFIGIVDISFVSEAITNTCSADQYLEELVKVFDYASDNSYDKWWEHPQIGQNP